MKAKEWVHLVDGHMRPRFSSSRIEAECNDYGDLADVVIGAKAIPPEEAIRFARWILAVFE